MLRKRELMIPLSSELARGHLAHGSFYISQRDGLALLTGIPSLQKAMPPQQPERAAPGWAPDPSKANQNLL